MALYEVYGKWYHLSYSDYFRHVVEARSPGAALLKLARCSSDVEGVSEVDWVQGKPRQIAVGRLDPPPEFWVGDDQLYQVRSITRVRAWIIECPTCGGTGKSRGFLRDDAGSQMVYS